MISWILNAAALGLVAYFVPGIHVHSAWAALGAVFVLGALNMLVRPVLLILTLPITFLTLGLFMFAINALMFYMAGSLFASFQVDNWTAAFLGSLGYSLAGSLISLLTGKRD